MVGTVRLLYSRFGKAKSSETNPDEAGSGSDGAILILGNASTADGAPRYSSEPDSSLGSPVGLAWEAPSLFVTESARHLNLRFDALLEHRGDLEFGLEAAMTLISPESVMLAASPRTIL